jgi:putative tricarboxylic transport membrane protein
VLLGGLVLLGIEAGPKMFTTNLPLTLSIVWTLAFANIFGTTLCFLMAKPISLLTTINPNKLVPFLLVIVCLGAYQANHHWGDLLILLLFGAISWFMKELDWPRIPFIIGFVLSNGAERYLFISISRYGYEWLVRPGVIIIGMIILLVIFGGQIFRKFKTHKGEAVGA